MIPARVIGRVIPGTILPAFQGVPLLVVERVDGDRRPTGDTMVVCDAVGANQGELVFIAQGQEATFVLPEPFNPADMTIVAIIDSME